MPVCASVFLRTLFSVYSCELTAWCGRASVRQGCRAFFCKRDTSNNSEQIRSSKKSGRKQKAAGKVVEFVLFTELLLYLFTINIEILISLRLI